MNIATRSICEPLVQRGFHFREFAGDPLSQVRLVSKLLRHYATHDSTSVIDKLIQLIVRADVEALKSIEELGQVRQCRISKHLRHTAIFAAKPFCEMADQLFQFACESLLRQSDRFIEATLNT